MKSSAHPPAAPKFPRWLLVGWALILVKCLLTPWAIAHWNVPIHAGWVIWPTLVFAGFVTLVVLMRRGLED